jgi:Ni,Fe-hydrogenase III large subunit
VIELAGDVLARFQVRAREVSASAALIEDLTARISGSGQPGSADARVAAVTDAANGSPRSGLGVIEAWRGTLVHRVEVDASGRLSRVRAVDPSFFNWPALPVALTDTIVPDFPLANKSFNQSYAGNDL